MKLKRKSGLKFKPVRVVVEEAMICFIFRLGLGFGLERRRVLKGKCCSPSSGSLELVSILVTTESLRSVELAVTEMALKGAYC